MILSDELILPVLQVQTQQLMTSQITSQITSHIEYLIHTYYTCAHFVVEIDKKKSSHNCGF